MKKEQELRLIALIVVSIIGSAGFIAVYNTDSLVYQGSALMLALLAFAAIAIAWYQWVIPHEKVEDLRDEYPSDFEQRLKEQRQAERVASQLTRKGVLGKLLAGALGIFGLALILPLRSLGNGPTATSSKSKWRAGVRAVREDGTPVKVSDLNVNSVVTVFPENAMDDPHSPTMLIRLPPEIPEGVDGYIAYSKICTHAGCPVALYRAAARQLLCPCHQSVFDVLNDGSVISGPADHPLPQLPLEVGPDGYIRAAGDYNGPIGPGSWDITS